MIRTILASALLIFMYSPGVSGLEQPSLILVDTRTSGRYDELSSQGLRIVHDHGEWAVAVATGAGGSVSAVSSYQRLGHAKADCAYYVIAAPRGVSLADLTAGVPVDPPPRILWSNGREAVVEASPEAIDWLSARGLDVARIFLEPLRAPRRAGSLRSVATDPVIETMVNGVSTDSINATVTRLQAFVTRHSTRDSCQAAANYIAARFRSFGIDSVTFHHWSSTYKDNVVAVLPGRGHPERMVVIGGHYDSTAPGYDVCPGADDNASGTSAVLECARLLSSGEYDYTLVFIAFCGEEQGLLGSAAYASEAAARGDDILAMVNVDMVGYVASGDILDLDLIANTSSQWLASMAQAVAGVYVPALPVLPGALPPGRMSDHMSFWNQGYDAIMFFEDVASYSPYIHTTNDIVGTSYRNPELATLSTKLAVALVAELARPFRVAIVHSPLPDTQDSTQPYLVTASLLTATELNADSAFVRYEAGAGPVSVPLMPAGGSLYRAYIPAQPGGTVLDYYVVAETLEGYRATSPDGAPALAHRFNVGVPVVIAEDDFEQESGWTVGAPDDDATTGIWERVDPNGTYYPMPSNPVQPEDDHTPEPGTMCYVTANAPPFSTQSAADVDDGKTTLFSPDYDLSAYTNVWVRYYRWYTNDVGGTPGGDVWTVDVSADGGATWRAMEVDSTSDRSWRFVERCLSDYVPLTSTVRFRFTAMDEGPASVVEALVDDFSLLAYVASPTARHDPDPPAKGVWLGQNYPNPFNPVTIIPVTTGTDGDWVTLRVFDVSGREVVTLLRDERVVGERNVRWDGRDRNGREAATGVYFYRLEATGRTLSRKLVLLR